MATARRAPWRSVALRGAPWRSVAFGLLWAIRQCLLLRSQITPTSGPRAYAMHDVGRHRVARGSLG